MKLPRRAFLHLAAGAAALPAASRIARAQAYPSRRCASWLASRPVEYIRAGKLHVLAVTTAARLDEFPDVPIIGEFVPGYEASAWYGIGAPKGTPADIVDKLNKETNAALADPKIKAQLAEFGGTMLAGSPADFGKFIATETEKWGKVVRFAGLKPE